jgi:hypothetical protein
LGLLIALLKAAIAVRKRLSTLESASSRIFFSRSSSASRSDGERASCAVSGSAAMRRRKAMGRVFIGKSLSNMRKRAKEKS